MRTTYGEIATRARKVAKALDALRHAARRPRRHPGLEQARHLESWYGITGAGAVYHTLNPRLFPDQIAWIANHAEDKVLFFDTTFAPICRADRADKMPSIKLFVAMTDRAHLPDARIPNLVAYEDFLGADGRRFRVARISTRTRPAACATPPAPPATPRACSTATAPTCCTR